ncbi:hypothetical protein BsWGS_00730 [Bradybaena similaris]
MIDLIIGLELDGFISNFMRFYLADGEPYLMTAHGAAINYWDGIIHFVLYLTMIILYTKRKSYRVVGLYWIGTVLNSMIVLLQGATAGNHPIKLSIMLNTPYAVLPLLAAFKFLHDRPHHVQYHEKVQGSKKHPVDLLFMIYFIVAIFFAVFRCMAVLGGTAETMKEYVKIFEPYLLDPTNFPKFQAITYGYFFFCLLSERCVWITMSWAALDDRLVFDSLRGCCTGSVLLLVCFLPSSYTQYVPVSPIRNSSTCVLDSQLDPAYCASSVYMVVFAKYQ